MSARDESGSSRTATTDGADGEQLRRLHSKIDSGAVRVGIVGLGYVGLPLARAFAGRGIAVLGFDVDPVKVALLLVPVVNLYALVLKGIAARRLDAAAGRGVGSTVLAVLLPLTRALPSLYVWMIRRRLVYWYRQLKALERNLDSGPYDAAALQAEFDRIDSAVRRIRVPLYYSDKLYDLRGHIDLVRQRLAVRPMPTRMAAE